LRKREGLGFKIMKVILHMAISVNGYITRGEDDSDWVSKEDWKEFDN